MRIIDTDKLIKCVEESRKNNCHKNKNVYTNHKNEHDHFIHMICCQPTAFDVDTVIEELEDLKMGYFLTLANTGDADKDCAYLNTANAIDRAIEIIKRGGTNEE